MNSTPVFMEKESVLAPVQIEATTDQDGRNDPRNDDDKGQPQDGFPVLKKLLNL